MVATITLACLVLCPSSPAPHLQTVNDEWRTHTANPFLDTTFTLDGVTFHTPHRSMGGDVDQWLPLVAGHFGDLGPDAIQTVLCLMGFESGGNPSARNPSSGASGLMQVLPSWAPKFNLEPADLFKPEINLFIARQLYNEAEFRGANGWNHWAPYQRGECR